MKANYGEGEIKSLLDKLRIFNREIGEYHLFAITEDFDYAVKLSNGKFLIKIEELQDDQNNGLTPVILEQISKRFKYFRPELPTAKSASDSVIEPYEPVRKSNTKRNIIIGILLIGALLFYGLNGNNDYSFAGEESYQQKVMTVEEMEQSEPSKFLQADGNYNENFWGDKIKVHGTITSSATVAKYKDAVVRVTYYSKTKTAIGQNDYTVYEIFEPHSTNVFELKIDNFNNVSSVGWQVVSASVVH